MYVGDEHFFDTLDLNGVILTTYRILFEEIIKRTVVEEILDKICADYVIANHSDLPDESIYEVVLQKLASGKYQGDLYEISSVEIPECSPLHYFTCAEYLQELKRDKE